MSGSPAIDSPVIWIPPIKVPPPYNVSIVNVTESLNRGDVVVPNTA